MTTEITIFVEANSTEQIVSLYKQIYLLLDQNEKTGAILDSTISHDLSGRIDVEASDNKLRKFG